MVLSVYQRELTHVKLRGLYGNNLSQLTSRVMDYV